MTSDELESLFEKVNRVKINADRADEKADEEESSDNKIKAKDGETRSTLTLTFMIGFFGILIFSCLFVFIYNWAAVTWAISLSEANLKTGASAIQFLEVDKILSIMIGALGTSLGFIIGYYFKEKGS